MLEVVDEDSTRDIQLLSRNVPTDIGAAGVHITSPEDPEISLSIPLGAMFSSYDAEVAAATTVFETVPLSVSRRAILWATDSRSVIEALGGNISHAGPQTQHLWKTISRRLSTNTKIIAVWVLAHCGILLNERADKLATAVTKLPFLDHNNVEVSSEVIGTFTRKKQVSRLTSLPEEDDYNLDIPKRRAEVTLNQSQTNCCPLVRTFRTSETYEPLCQACSLGVPETVEHLLKRCPGRTIARRKHLGRNSLGTIEEICSKYPLQVLEFIRDVGLL